jgi:hypothetical protein
MSNERLKLLISGIIVLMAMIGLLAAQITNGTISAPLSLVVGAGIGYFLTTPAGRSGSGGNGGGSGRA